MRYKRIIWLMALLVTVVMAWGQETVLTDNENGTWTLSCMPPYDVTLQVEYEDDGTPIVPIDLVDNGDGTWTLACMPPYDVTLQVEYEDEPEVYTEFVEETGTMTYYYDDKRTARDGVTELYDPVGNPDAVRFTGYYANVLKAVIDPSMKNAPLTSFRNMFYGGMDTSFKIHELNNMTSVEGMENLNTDDVTNMRNMFGGCYSLATIDLSSFNTAKVTDMQGMFTSCRTLTSIDVSSFDISNVTEMRSMFIDCPALTTIYCSNDWSTSTAQSGYMFSGCTSLIGGEGTVFDKNVIDNTYARPDGGTSAPGYFTEKPTYLVGDANGNGEVEIGDVTSVLTLMATPEATGYDNKAADANGNGEIEIGDVTTILTIMAGN